jgi:hypothetical protein
MRRYSILVRERGSDRLVELAQCDTNPSAVADGLGKKTLRVSVGLLPAVKTKLVPKYDHIELVDNQAAKSA